MPRAMTCLFSLAFGLQLIVECAAREPDIKVLRPKTLGVDKLPAERVALGIPNDYKPCVALLKNGHLAVIAFHAGEVGGGKYLEPMILFRSQDGGRTWSKREELKLLGREPYFSVLKDGTLFITACLLKQDIRNKDGAAHRYLYRSTDGGRTWETLKITLSDVPGAQGGSQSAVSRNVLELSDGSLLLGISAYNAAETHGLGDCYLWRSKDKGKTWDRSLVCKFQSVDKDKLFGFDEVIFWQARSGALLGLMRVEPKDFPLPSTKKEALPPPDSDQYHRLLVLRSRDGGRTWARAEELGGSYGEMYPSILRLQDGRLLLTFTVRSLRPPLGVHAVLGKETEDSFVFDFDHDRLVLDAKTPKHLTSGGGYGPTVQLADGTLVTAYSYRGADSKFRLEVMRWKLPAQKSREKK